MHNKKRWIILLLSILLGSIIIGYCTHDYIKGVIFCTLIAIITNFLFIKINNKIGYEVDF
jgi:hypothetical protein